MKCQTIVTHFRPVPLTWQFCWDTESSGTQMVQLMGKKGRTLNPALAPPPPPDDFEWNRGSKRRGRWLQLQIPKWQCMWTDLLAWNLVCATGSMMIWQIFDRCTTPHMLKVILQTNNKQSLTNAEISAHSALTMKFEDLPPTSGYANAWWESYTSLYSWEICVSYKHQ